MPSYEGGGIHCELMDSFALFATPLHVFDLPNMEATNRELASRLLAEAEKSPGMDRSNVGGWHSVPDLSRRPEACYRTLMQAVIDRVRQVYDIAAAAAGIPPGMQFRYALQSWAMVMMDGDYTTLHDHADAHWSVAYYVDAGDADVEGHPDSGRLAFIDPRRAGRAFGGVDLYPSTFTVRPRTSSLVIFPGYLQHYVHAYRGQRPRICISCNVVMEPAGPPPQQR